MRGSTLLDAHQRATSRQVETPTGPTLAETVGAIISMATCGDDGKRNAIARALTRTMGGLSGANENGVDVILSDNLTRSILPEIGLTRTMTEGLGGPAGGFTVKPGFGPEVFDRRRPTVTPVGLVEWWPCTERRIQLSSRSRDVQSDRQSLRRFQSHMGTRRNGAARGR